jgi:putative transposase
MPSMLLCSRIRCHRLSMGVWGVTGIRGIALPPQELHRPMTEPPRHVRIDSCQTAALVTNALGMAIANRDPQSGGIIHSDHGVQFTSWAFTDRAKRSGLVPSMGSIGDCYDNAMIESFWGRMQTELLNRKRWKTRIELANAIFDYLEIFHNRQRRHSALGMRTPIEFELLHQSAQPVA